MRSSNHREAGKKKRERGKMTGNGAGGSASIGGAVVWENLTWEEIGGLAAAGMELALLPVGATEQHGPHLGVGVDSVCAMELAHAVSAKTGAPVLPVVRYGCSLGHSRRWPGTIALQPQTLIDMVVQIFEWAHSFGFRRLIIINGHVTNFAPLRCALEVIRSRFDDAMVAVRNVAEISERVRAEFYADAEDWHANAAETALMMARAPGIVRAEKVAGSDDEDRTAGLVFSHPVNRTSRNGVTGYPSRATLEQGERLFGWMVADLTEQVRAAMQEKAPLEQSYFISS
jgi:creatinine amidohydrolase